MDIIKQVKIQVCRKMIKVCCSALGRKTEFYRDHLIEHLLKVVTSTNIEKLIVVPIRVELKKSKY